LRRRAAAAGGADALPFAHLHRARDQGGGAGQAGPAPHGREPGANQAMGIRHRDRGHGARRRDADRRRAGGAEPRPRLHRPHLLRRRACGPRQHDRNAACRPDPRGLRVDRADAVRRLVGAGGRLRAAAGGARHPSPGAVRTMKFWIGVAATVALAAGLAVSFIMHTAIVNWRYVGGATGVQLLRPPAMPLFDSYTRMLFVVMAVLAVAGVCIARYIEVSWIGRGLRAIRDSEEAAECSGVPTLKLKLFACTVSGALMGAAGAPLPMYMSFLEPACSFDL